MAKRFTDTNKWKKTWFRQLSPIHKCFWLYLCDNCDHAGIWEVDFELAAIFIKSELDVDGIKKEFGKQFEEIDGGKKWFIKDFIDFQYGELNPDNRAHNSVLQVLNRYGAYKGLTRPMEGRKDKDKDKDKDRNREVAKFDNFWQLYPKKLAKQDAVKAWDKIQLTDDLFQKIIQAVTVHKLSADWKKENGKFIPYPATWLNASRWEDEIISAKQGDPGLSAPQRKDPGL